MNETVREVLDFVSENDVQFVRLAFCNLLGTQKNMSIMPDELPAAFREGVSFDANAVTGFGGGAKSDLLLFPQAETLQVLPWRPGPGRVIRFYCAIKNPDGSDFRHDSRNLLKGVLARLAEENLVCKLGAECEFYLFKTDEDGRPTSEPYDQGGYLDIAPLDKGENIRREICLSLAEMGIKPEASHHEQGPGQNEIDFAFSDALSTADNILSFKTVVKAIAARNGLHASFLPKPLAETAGSGMHLNLSLFQYGKNIFKNAPGEHSATAESFLAGVLAKAAEITLFLNPLANSYERLGKMEAPQSVSWSHQDRSALIRIPAATGEKVRMELRSPDPSANPYLAIALVIAAGLEGIKQGLPLPPAASGALAASGEKPGEASFARLPKSLVEAITLAEESDFVRQVLGDSLLETYLTLKKAEASAEVLDPEALYQTRDFELI